ncbi:hypothetical protein [Bacteroides sp. UBA939]|uniref:hypothetical protein n=1 Tax=Bacteroides sp. UBA939 TaxID=1946092 RepID=UPI0025BBE00D|nr:hypothetical protein [Bacteroides sp. UBA939]
MKYIRVLFAVAFVFTVCSAFSLKKGKGDKEKVVYAFGVAASFNDTVVYFTDIQVLDSVKLNKSGFLPKRDLYSYQLKNYLEYDLKSADYTCMIYFSENKNKLTKEVTTLKSKYKKNKSIVLIPIDTDAFRFKKPEE